MTPDLVQKRWRMNRYILICRFEVPFCKLSKLRKSIYIYIFHHSHKNLDTSEHPSIFQQFIIWIIDQHTWNHHKRSPQRVTAQLRCCSTRPSAGPGSWANHFRTPVINCARICQMCWGGSRCFIFPGHTSQTWLTSHWDVMFLRFCWIFQMTLPICSMDMKGFQRIETTIYSVHLFSAQPVEVCSLLLKSHKTQAVSLEETELRWVP